MANDRISGQVNSQAPPPKLDYWIGLIVSAFCAALCSVMFFLMPCINSLEDETTYRLSETLAGRFDIAMRGLLALLVISLVPAAMNYGFIRIIGISAGRPLRNNRAFQMAKTVYLVWIMWGVAGAVSFMMGRTPLNVFGF